MQRRIMIGVAVAALLAAFLVPAAAAKKPVGESPEHYQTPVTASAVQATPFTPGRSG
jgi:hypothetical protein